MVLSLYFFNFFFLENFRDYEVFYYEFDKGIENGPIPSNFCLFDFTLNKCSYFELSKYSIG
jgi:hypothetical protein